MNVRDVMSNEIEILPYHASLREAASRMQELNCGFLPVASEEGNRVTGVITDRDIVVRGIAKGHTIDAPVRESMSRKLHYCFSDDSLSQAAEVMQDEKVYRLIVLNDMQKKQFVGVITLGDILRQGETSLAEAAAEQISIKAA